MTDPIPAPLPIDVSGIDEPLKDLGHEAIRTAALGAIQTVWVNHQGLVAALAAARGDLAATQADVADLKATTAQQAQQIADLQAAVTALTQPATP